MTLVVEARTAQVDGVNQRRFFLDEHARVKGQVDRSAGMDIEELSIKDLPELARQCGGFTKAIGEAAGDVPARNKELVAPAN